MKKILSLFCLITIVLFSSHITAEEIHGNVSGHETEKMQVFQFDFKSAYIIEKELETNLFYRYLDSDEEDIHFTLFELEYAVNDRIKLSVEIPYEAYEEIEIEHDSNGHEEKHEISEGGVGDIELVGAYAFLKQNKTLPEAAIGIKFISPTGDEDKGLGEGVWGFKPFLRVSKTWDKFALHGSLSYGLFNNIEETEHHETVDSHGHHVSEMLAVEKDLSEFEFAFSAVYMPTDNIDMILEFSGIYEEEELFVSDAAGHGIHLENEYTTFLYATPGIKYKISTGLEAGVAVPIGLNDDSFDWGVMFRINKAFALGGHH